MRRIDQITIVAKREIVERSRSTVFRVMLVAMALLVGGGIIALSFINPSSRPIHIGLAGDVIPGLEGDIETVAETVEQQVTITTYPSTQAADTALEDGDVDVLLVDSSTVVTSSGASLTRPSSFQRPSMLQEDVSQGRSLAFQRVRSPRLFNRSPSVTWRPTIRATQTRSGRLSPSWVRSCSLSHHGVRTVCGIWGC